MLFDLFKKKDVPAKKGVDFSPEVANWRPNMWVMTPDGVGIIFKLGVECEVHLTDASGVTFLIKLYPIAILRQARLMEIPAARRKITKEIATKLGYF